jgi:hypothetical protein
MLRFVLSVLMMLFVVSHGGLGGAADHEHRNAHVHGVGAVHEHDTGSEPNDQGDDPAFHVHLIADRTPAGHQVDAPSRSGTLFMPTSHYALASMASAPPLEPPEAA